MPNSCAVKPVVLIRKNPKPPIYKIKIITPKQMVRIYSAESR
jgi:hypothetical protein